MIIMNDKYIGELIVDLRDYAKAFEGRRGTAGFGIAAKTSAEVIERLWKQLRTHRSEVMNPPASAAQGAEARNLNTEQRHGTGAVPRGAKSRPGDASPLPWRCQNMGHKRYLMFHCTECPEVTALQRD